MFIVGVVGVQNWKYKKHFGVCIAEDATTRATGRISLSVDMTGRSDEDNDSVQALLDDGAKEAADALNPSGLVNENYQDPGQAIEMQKLEDPPTSCVAFINLE